MVATAALCAVYQVLSRRLAGVEGSETSIFHTAVTALALSFLALPFAWRLPSLEQWATLALIGAIGGGGHFLPIQAFAHAPASLLAPLAYTQMVWATLAGWLLFDEWPDLASILGVVIGAGGGLFVFLAESCPGRGG